MIRLPSMFEEGGDWPHDPLNVAIATTLVYSVVPVMAIVAIFEIADWNETLPLWLTLSPLVHLIIIGWIALDEWRSRRHSEDGEGHGWIWQVVSRYGPRHRFNQAMIALIVIAHFAGAVLVYVDRFAARDLEHLEVVRIVEAAVIIPVDVWIVAIVFRWFASVNSYWPLVRFALLVVVVVNALMSIGDGPFPWIVLPLLASIVLALPGWLLYLAWTNLRPPKVIPTDGTLPDELMRPDW